MSRGYNTTPLPVLSTPSDWDESTTVPRTAPLPTLSPLFAEDDYFKENVEDMLPAALVSWSSLMSGELPSLRRRTFTEMPSMAEVSPLLSDTELGGKHVVQEVVIGKQSALQASFSIVKAVVGAGSFALPYGFLMAGLWGGIGGILALGILSCITILMLIDCKNKLPGLHGKYVTYVDIARETFGTPLAVVLYIAIIVTSLGACSAYLVFCGSLLEDVSRKQLEAKYFVIILGGPLVIFAMIRSFRYLSFTSILGDIALLVGMAAMFIEGFRNESIDNPTDYPAGPSEPLNLCLFFGSAAFLFCVHMLMVPVEQSMKEPKQFKAALLGSFAFVTTLNLVFGAIGYMLFKDKTKEIIIQNLNDNIFVDIAKVMLVFDLFFTYVVVIVPARDIVEASLLKPAVKEHVIINEEVNVINGSPTSSPTPSGSLPPTQGLRNNWIVRHLFSSGMVRNFIRAAMVGITVVIATVVNQFQTLIGLVSGLSLSLMAFILPPLIHIKLNWKSMVGQDFKPIMFLVFLFDVGMILFGLAAAGTTTYVSIKGIIENGIGF